MPATPPATSPTRYAPVKSPRPKPPPVPLAPLHSEDSPPPSTTLPPLPMSPRHRDADATRAILATLLPFQRPPQAVHADAVAVSPRQSSLPHVGRDYPVAQLDSWPLTSLSHSPSTSSSSSIASPLSPRARISHARHRLMDESKSKPALLTELLAFLHAELAAIDQPVALPPQENDENDTTSNRAASLARLQVFRAVFHRVVAAFSVYAPLLSQLQDEYERVVASLLRECQRLPQLHSSLQSREAQCLREISRHRLEASQRQRFLEHTLTQTQARLTASAAHNAHLLEELTTLKTELAAALRRCDEMQRSNSALVSGIRRQDDTLRHIHDRSREEGFALATMAAKYHHACEEIAELKVTVASLEEKVGGVHVAADKATIALLTRELQETHARLQAATKATGGGEEEEVMASLLVKVLASNGAVATKSELLEALRADAGRPPTVDHVASLAVDRVAASLTAKISAFHSQQQQTHSSTTAVFLTETPETGVAFAQANAQLLPHVLSSPTDLIQARGCGADVPEFLQYDGVVRQLFYDRRRVETLVAKVWSHHEELNGQARRGSVTLAHAFSLYLQRCFSSRHEAVECAYNVEAALARFSAASSDCRLFALVLHGQLPHEARADQARTLYSLHDLLFALHREQKNQAASSVHTGLPLAEVVRALRRHFPWKTDRQLSRLHAALLLDVRGAWTVDYAALLHDDKGGGGSRGKPGARSQFCELLRAQYMDDLLAYRAHLERQLGHAVLADGASGGMLSMRAVRACLQRCDAAKPVQDINRLLCEATGLAMDQVLTQDDMVMSVPQLLAKLPSLLVKPSGKCLEEESSGDHPEAVAASSADGGLLL